jgi:hypothetical protein
MRSTDVFVESYRGTYEQARAMFSQAAARYAAEGFEPTTQSWVEQGPRWGCFTCAIIIILLISIIGILLLPFVFWGRNKGTLTVTYTRRRDVTPPPYAPPAG